MRDLAFQVGNPQPILFLDLHGSIDRRPLGLLQLGRQFCNALIEQVSLRLGSFDFMIALADLIPLLAHLAFELLDLALVRECQVFQSRLLLCRRPGFLLQLTARRRQFRLEVASNLILLPFGGGEFRLAPRFQLIQARSQCRSFDRYGFVLSQTLFELRFNGGLLLFEFTNLKSKFGDTLPFLDELIVLVILLDLIFIA